MTPSAQPRRSIILQLLPCTGARAPQAPKPRGPGDFERNFDLDGCMPGRDNRGRRGTARATRGEGGPSGGRELPGGRGGFIRLVRPPPSRHRLVIVFGNPSNVSLQTSHHGGLGGTSDLGVVGRSAHGARGEVGWRARPLAAWAGLRSKAVAAAQAAKPRRQHALMRCIKRAAKQTRPQTALPARAGAGASQPAWGAAGSQVPGAKSRSTPGSAAGCRDRATRVDRHHQSLSSAEPPRRGESPPPR